jgi:hypothetical protein
MHGAHWGEGVSGILEFLEKKFKFENNERRLKYAKY